MVFLATWHWGKPPCHLSQFPPLDFNPQWRQKHLLMASGLYGVPCSFTVWAAELGHRDNGSCSLFWNFDGHWINATITHVLREETENWMQTRASLGVVVYRPTDTIETLRRSFFSLALIVSHWKDSITFICPHRKTGLCAKPLSGTSEFHFTLTSCNYTL